MLYKIVPEGLWREARAAGVFTGAEVDRADGFIHLSSAAQVRETARRHFAGQADLRLIGLDADRLPGLRWEPSRGGALFPHVYGDLPLEAVVSDEALPWDGAAHAFPASVPDDGAPA